MAVFDYWPLQRLDKATSTIDTVVACVRRQIELLREYRARLIADAVTGKLDVREAAAGPCRMKAISPMLSRLVLLTT